MCWFDELDYAPETVRLDSLDYGARFEHDGAEWIVVDPISIERLVGKVVATHGKHDLVMRIEDGEIVKLGIDTEVVAMGDE